MTRASEPCGTLLLWMQRLLLELLERGRLEAELKLLEEQLASLALRRAEEAKAAAFAQGGLATCDASGRGSHSTQIGAASGAACCAED